MTEQVVTLQHKQGSIQKGIVKDNKFYVFPVSYPNHLILKGWREYGKKLAYIPLEEYEYKTTTEEKKEMDDPHTYRFVSRSEDVDFHRIIREAPKGTDFILVEERDRSNRPTSATLLVHNSILYEPVLQGKKLVFSKVSPEWGHNNNPGFGGPEYIQDYRYYAFHKKFPGFVKQQIEKLKAALNPKNTKTEVKYL